MQDCQVCGRRFDPIGFQVVVPELARGFDRVECARSARALAPIGTGIATAPLVALVEPVALAPAPSATPALRPLGISAATLGLLAAGTAAAALLWVRALGTDSESLDFARSATPPAVAQETVQAHVQPAPLTSGGPVAGVLRERISPVSLTTSPIAVRRPADLASRRARPASSGSSHDVGGPPAPSAPTVAARTTGKDHVKRGRGHYKHGESDGIHTPGHGGGNGGGHGHGKERGHGKSHGHGKGH